MAAKVAFDFGTSNTVIAVWSDQDNQAHSYNLQPYALSIEHNNEPAFVIPSLINYDGNQLWLGSQVNALSLPAHCTTVRWMKRYVAVGSVRKVRTAHGDIGMRDAAGDFLRTIMLACAAELEIGDEEIAVTCPVEAFEDYAEWLVQVAASAGLSRIRLIDEPSAAALGLGISMQPGDVFLAFDFGGGSLDVSVLAIENPTDRSSWRHCRVLGKAGVLLGGTTIDQWIFEEVLARTGRNEHDEQIRQCSLQLLARCETAKQRLTTAEQTEIQVDGLVTTLRREEFESLLEKNGALRSCDQAVRKAMRDAQERGVDYDDLKAVLLVGGSSLIPSVRRMLQRIFGKERVVCRSPLDAVAKGASALLAGVALFDHIEHEYAVRFYSVERSEYCYRTIVKAGSAYPSKGVVAAIAINATNEGQTEFGIDIFELGRNLGTAACGNELVFDSSGAPRLVQVTEKELEKRSRFWMNEKCRFFLRSDSPRRPGEAAFELTFEIDDNKRLLVTAVDAESRRQACRQLPVVRLA